MCDSDRPTFFDLWGSGAQTPTDCLKVDTACLPLREELIRDQGALCLAEGFCPFVLIVGGVLASNPPQSILKTCWNSLKFIIDANKVQISSLLFYPKFLLKD